MAYSVGDGDGPWPLALPVLGKKLRARKQAFLGRAPLSLWAPLCPRNVPNPEPLERSGAVFLQWLQNSTWYSTKVPIRRWRG